MPFPRLFEPLRLGDKITLRNRIVLPAHGPRISGDRYIRYLDERVKDIGLYLCSQPASSGVAAYSPGPPASLPPGHRVESDARLPDPASAEGKAFLDDLYLPFMRRQVEVGQRYGVACFGQVVHTGNYSFHTDWQVGISPSAVPDELLGETPHALTRSEIADVVATFANAAERVKAAGMAGVEVHCCHGLLLNAFLSPITNRRTDDYGGSPENRARLLREVVAAVRERVGPGLVVGVRIAGQDGIDGGLTTDDTAAALAPIVDQLDYLSVSASSEGGRKGGVTVPAIMSADYPEAVFEPSARKLRETLGLPVILSGRITQPATAERVLADGSADLVGIVRAMLADPTWPRKARDGEEDDIRLCTGNNECRYRTQLRVRAVTGPVACAVNAAAGREEEMDSVAPAVPKRVLVVGGGPGGLEAARVAALRGHTVTLCERDTQLGGQALIAGRDPRSAGLGRAVAQLERQVRKLDAVDVQLGREVGAADVAALAPEAVIVATGALPPPLPSPAAVSVIDVLRGEAKLGARVCIVAGMNGHRAPLALAAKLADERHDVHLVTERTIVGEDLDPGVNHTLLKLLYGRGVDLRNLTGLRSFEDGVAVLYNTLTRHESQLAVDSLVVATRGPANDALSVELQDAGLPMQAIGDCLAPRRLIHAILEGHRAALAV
jgi:2,4-dienoyl-CoA reductase (NADPH2)